MDRNDGSLHHPWLSPGSRGADLAPSQTMTCFHLFAAKMVSQSVEVQTQQKAVTFFPKILRQDPLEAVLVIFGRRALNFLFESSLKKVKNDSTFVRMRSGDHLGDAKMSKKGTSLRRIQLFY